MVLKDSDVRPNVPVDMDVTRQRFAVLTTSRDARWRAVPADVDCIDCARAHELALQSREQLRG